MYLNIDFFASVSIKVTREKRNPALDEEGTSLKEIT